MLSIIGNSPSSGSNLLAQLCDSTKYSACGVEMKMFANKNLYDFEKYKKNVQCTSIASGAYNLRHGTNFKRIYNWGLNLKQIREMAQSSSDLREFRETFAYRFLALRGKDVNGIVFEKTPSNINCINEFTEAFDDSYFIHIVRNPLYIYPSLLKRKFSNYIASITWLLSVAKYIKYKNNPRTILIKYEDLLQTPYKTMKDILKTTAGITNVTEEEIEQGYHDNKYRKIFSPKVKTWNVNEYGSIKSANVTKFDDQQLQNLARMLNVKITSAYARKFDMAEISFIDATKEFGYYDDVMEKLEPFRNIKKIPYKTAQDYAWLILKWEEDFRHGDTHPFEIQNYLTPIERI